MKQHHWWQIKLKTIQQKAQKNPSLRQQLLWSLSAFSIALFMVLGFSAYQIALEETEEILDKQMKEMAYFLAETSIEHLSPTFKPNNHYNETDVFIDVWTYSTDPEQQLQDPKQFRLPKTDAPHFQQVQSSMGELKAFVLPLSKKQVQISQLMTVRQHLAGELALSMLIPYVLLMPLVLWGLSWLLRRHLSPLIHVQQSIASRDHDDLSAIDTTALPMEILPPIAELNRLFERIDHAQRQQQQFIADAAHELRSPITALNLQLKVLQTTLPYPIAQDKNFVTLKNGLNRVQHLVTQMMTLAHQEADPAQQIEALDLREHVTQVVEQLMYQANKRQIDLGLSAAGQRTHIKVLATPIKLHSIIANLMDNAIKYSPDHGSIDIHIEQQGQYGCLSIEDSGSGVQPADYPKLIERFVRLNHHQDVVGSGLGLSIVYSAVKQLDGELHFAQSTRLGGLSVTVMLLLA
jgi:two-component system OmpR family sensor kinase